MKEPTTLDVLKAARAKIARPYDWGRGPVDDRINPRSYCASQAIEKAASKGPFRLQWHVRRAFKNAIGSKSIIYWNDAPERTHAEVLAAFDLAIALERDMPRAS